MVLAGLQVHRVQGAVSGGYPASVSRQAAHEALVTQPVFSSIDKLDEGLRVSASDLRGVRQVNILLFLLLQAMAFDAVTANDKCEVGIYNANLPEGIYGRTI